MVFETRQGYLRRVTDSISALEKAPLEGSAFMFASA